MHRNEIEHSLENDCEKHMKLTPKGYQNEVGIDAKTHQQSMPKQVSKKIMKIIKNHVSLKGDIIQIHCKNNGFEGLAGCARERKRYQQKPSKVTPKSIPKSMKIDTNFMLEKGIPKT